MTSYPWPTPTQLLLLQTALADWPAATNAWQAWKKEVHLELDQLDDGSFRLLPLIYHNLSRGPISDEYLPKLKGIYRQTWYKNQMRFHHIRKVVTALEAAGIQTLLLKGPALVLAYYPNYGCRPMRDFDLLVPFSETMRAFQMLLDLGWLPKYTPVERFRPELIATRHAENFVYQNQYEFDLHWHLLHELPTEADDLSFWQQAIPIQLEQIPTRVLNPADQLLHVCVHGLRWSPAPLLHWLADVVVILRTSTLDWPYFVQQVARYQFSLVAVQALGYVQTHFQVDIPAGVLDDLRALPVSRPERLAYHYRISPPSWLGELPLLWLRYQRLHPKQSLWQRGSNFGSYVQRSFDLDSRWDLVALLARKALRRIYLTLRSGRI